MLRKRVITLLTFNNGVLFRTKLFNPDYIYTHNFVDAWLADEIIALNITRNLLIPLEESSVFGEVLKKLASRCFVPLAAGGGIRNLDDVKKIMNLGADKVVINTGALENPNLIDEIAQKYGSQCMVLSMDVRNTSKVYEVYSHFATRATGRHPLDWALEAQKLGVGEVLINSVERDGSLQGYDLFLCKSISSALNIPVLISGGAGTWSHFAEGILSGGADGVCTTNIFHFTESSIRSAKSYLTKLNIPVRTT